MAKSTRLNRSHRERLRTFLSNNTKLPEMDAYAAAEKAAAKLVARDTRKRYPTRDMKVLVKYGKAGPAVTVRGSCPSGEVVRFDFSDQSTAPLVPDYMGTIVRFADDTATAVEEARRAEEKRSVALSKVRADYDALITSATTFEQIVADWPAAEALRSEICESRALTTLSQEARARIRKSNVGANTKAA